MAHSTQLRSVALFTPYDRLYCILPGHDFMLWVFLYLLLSFSFLPVKLFYKPVSSSLWVIFRSAFYFVFNWVIFFVNYPCLVSWFPWVSTWHFPTVHLPPHFLSRFCIFYSLILYLRFASSRAFGRSEYTRSLGKSHRTAEVLPIVGFWTTLGIGKQVSGNNNKYR